VYQQKIVKSVVVNSRLPVVHRIAVSAVEKSSGENDERGIALDLRFRLISLCFRSVKAL
jgi:hypothetical protein